MAWLELRLVVLRPSIDVVSQRLFELGTTGVQEDYVEGEAPPVRQPWDRGPAPPLPARALLRSWWPSDEQSIVESVLSPWITDGTILDALQWAPVVDQDWSDAWRAGFERIVISDHLCVAPPWEAQTGDLVIEPGMAFGTGEHPTTRACLTAIERLARPGGRMLDVGCGTGVLALAAGKLGMNVWGVDTDKEAIQASHENRDRNHLQGHFEASPLEAIHGEFELVVANLYAEVLVELAPAIMEKTEKYLILAGVLADRRAMVERAFSGLRLVEAVLDGEWVCLEYRR